MKFVAGAKIKPIQGSGEMTQLLRVVFVELMLGVSQPPVTGGGLTPSPGL